MKAIPWPREHAERLFDEQIEKGRELLPLPVTEEVRSQFRAWNEANGHLVELAFGAERAAEYRAGGVVDLYADPAYFPAQVRYRIDYLLGLRRSIAFYSTEEASSTSATVGSGEPAADTLVYDIRRQKELLIDVATGGPRINTVESEYVDRRGRIVSSLHERRLADPNPFADLWQWYAKWRADLPTYASRRSYINDLYGPLEARLANPALDVGSELFAGATGWAKVDRQVDKVRESLESATAEEDFQAVGLHCRETLISLAQAVYNPALHSSSDGVVPSATDGKRMLDAYLAAEHSGPSNEKLRKATRAAIDLAVELQHRRTATFRDAALCAEATIAAVNLIAILRGRRDP